MNEERAMDFEQQVVVAMRASAERVTPPVEVLVRAGERRGLELRRRRSRYAVALSGGVGVVAAALIALGSVLGLWSPAETPPASTPSPPPAACPAVVRTDVLPQWAWTGFSNPRAGGVPYVMGEKGNILAVLFGQPLSSPEAKDHANKILWVSRQDQVPAAPLVVTGTASHSLQPVPVVVTIPGGPGPSYLDLPFPGCWHLDLSWDNGKQRDSMDLVYVKPAG
jgi:hypothetical protein